MSIEMKLPLIALRGMVMFPNNVLSFEVSRSKSVEAMEKASEEGKLIFLTAQKDMALEAPLNSELFDIGTISEIKKIMPITPDSVRVIAQGKQKAVIKEFLSNEDYFEVQVLPVDTSYNGEMDDDVLTLMMAAKEAFSTYAVASGKILPEITEYVLKCENPEELADLIGSNAQIKFEDKQQILALFHYTEKLNKIIEILVRQKELLSIQKGILEKVKKNVDQSQKEYYLKEQAKVINEELGDRAGVQGEIEDYKVRAGELKLPDYVKEKLEKEFKRLSKVGNYAQEGVVIRDYIEWVLDIPWNEKSEENAELRLAEKVLNEDHYGLTEVKERVIEFLAVRQNTQRLDAPIICLVGPPGVGKTSVAKSIARALNREYVRMSLGGVRDEAEIRGHRRTYVGSMPGRIISSMKQAKTTNPVLLFDEIDKLSSDYKGDPSSALLEVLDGEQNNTFRDHYLEMPYDLSDVLFICTANTTQTIPAALFDRLEIIELSSYTSIEKENIAAKFLIKKQMHKHGIHSGVMYIDPTTITDIIRYYTKESGVRQLERLIARICRKVVKKSLMGQDIPIEIYPHELDRYLGARKYKDTKPVTGDELGLAVGLAWTKFGGDTLVIEVNVVKGRGKFEFTGNVGKVMKESAQAAISYIRANTKMLGIDENFYKKQDIHIHIPEGAVPKDGPSAGITMAVAFISALTGKCVAANLAMTGEITLRGRVLPIGGLKEKLLAAKAAGIVKVLVPFDNDGDVADIEADVKNGLEIILVKTMDDVINHAFM